MIRPVIAITLYRRPKQTRLLFASLERCFGFEEFPCVIAQDYSEEHKDACDEVWRLSQEFAAKHSNVSLHQNNPKLGIDLNKLFVVPKAYEQGDYVILIEDDIGLAPDALRYFVAMGEKFKDEKSIFSISGYNRFPASEWIRRKEQPYAIERCTGYVPWGVGIWRDRWDELFGNDGGQYKQETGHQANGLHDHWINAQHRGYIRPVVGRTNHTSAEAAEHTPNEAWLRENEYCFFGAWQLDLPDNPRAWE